MDEDSSTEHNIWQVYSFGKRNVFRFHLMESREGFCRNGRWRWTENREGAGTTVAESLVRKVWCLKLYQKQSGEYGRVK